MKTTLATLGLALVLSAPIMAQADEASDKLGVSKAIVEKTVLKTLDTGFAGALDKAVSQMPQEKADKVRADARAEFDKQRQILSEGLSKTYAEKFSLSELKHIQEIYDDKVYQKFQALNSDPKSEINVISQAAVTKLLNMLSLAAASEQQGGVPGGAPGEKQQRPMQMPPMPK